ncbi:hypothetical protein J2X75_001767 [Paenibacillus sp. 2003]|nr:hypothetical protein [Paenibacillus sp. 2003]
MDAATNTSRSFGKPGITKKINKKAENFSDETLTSNCKVYMRTRRDVYAMNTKEENITENLNESLGRIEEIFTNTPDLIIRKLSIKQTGELAAIIYMEELTDKASLNQNVLAPLQLETGNSSGDFIRDRFSKYSHDPSLYRGQRVKGEAVYCWTAGTNASIFALFGNGFYARAYQYPLYKEAQADWGKELSRAHFDVVISL